MRSNYFMILWKYMYLVKRKFDSLYLLCSEQNITVSVIRLPIGSTSQGGKSRKIRENRSKVGNSFVMDIGEWEMFDKILGNPPPINV